MLFLDGVYVDSANGAVARFRWVKAPTNDELTQLAHAIAQRIGCFLERDAENGYLASDAVDEDPMEQLLGHSMMCRDARMPRSAWMRESGHLPHRRAVGPNQGRKVFTLQTLPAGDAEDPFGDTALEGGRVLPARRGGGPGR